MVHSNDSHTRNPPKFVPESQTELLPMQQTAVLSSLDSSAIVIDKLNARLSSSTDLVLQDISLHMESGSTTMILGNVGAGKSVLLKAILGEVVCISGSISVKTSRIAYCSQSPWLINATIQENITCADVSTAIDETWYKQVIHACDLDQDLQQLPDVDRTLVGSRGVTLSGGQKHRVVSTPLSY